MEGNCEVCSESAGQRPLRCAEGCGRVCHQKKKCNPTEQYQGDWICRSCSKKMEAGTMAGRLCLEKLKRDVNNNSKVSLCGFLETNS